MVNRDDVPHEKGLPEPIRLTVTSVNNRPKRRRDVELTATDSNGDEIRIVVWETHDVDQQWIEGVEYEVEGARGKRYGTHVELHSTNAFQVREIDPPEATRLLVLGDTHVGYRHRPESEKPRWARDVNGRDVFTRCLSRARSADVDAIVHAGDVFDHHNVRGDRNLVGQEIERCARAGIPFYYVFGNHDDTKGRQLLERSSGIHLEQDIPLVGEPPVNLIGMDHAGHAFPTEAPDAPVEMLLNRNIAVIHETPYPVVDEQDGLVYENDSNEADISGFIDSAHFGVDLLVTGHLHVAKEARVRGYRIPVLVTGPTIPISTYEKENRPSTWLVTVSDDGIDYDRQLL